MRNGNLKPTFAKCEELALPKSYCIAMALCPIYALSLTFLFKKAMIFLYCWYR